MIGTNRLTKALSGAVVLLGLLSLPVGATPVAMVTDLVGTAELAEAGSRSALDLLANVPVNANLKVPAGSALVITYLDTAVEYRLEGPAEARAERSALVAVSGNSPEARDLFAGQDVKVSPIDVAQASLVMRGTGTKTPAVKLLSPRNTKTLSAHPELRWHGPADTDLELELTNENGELLLLETVQGSAFQLPDDVQLEPGLIYTWSITARGGNSAGAEWADFEIANEAERARAVALRPSADAPFSERLVYAVLLDELELHEAARAIWAALAEERPDSGSIKQLAEN